MTTPTAPTTSPAQPQINGEPVLPLEQGDHLTRDEFERRYTAMPHVKKAELIEGVVHMSSPVSFEGHGEPQAHLLMWLGLYRAFTLGTRVADNATVRLDLDNEPQPDGLLIIDPSRGGRTTITDDFITGGPELAAEVASSSASIDRNTKLRAYRRNSVQEYLLWRVRDRAIDWFALRAGQYDPLTVGADGVVRSQVFPGLWLDVQALLADDLARVVAVLQLGLASPEHADFVARMPPIR
jgi:Uma2 family endonuclease